MRTISQNFLPGFFLSVNVITALVISVLFTGCEKNDLVAITSLVTIEPSFRGTVVVSGGRLTANKEIELLDYGVCYSTRDNPSIEDNVAPGQDLELSMEQSRFSAEYSSQLSPLSSGTTYYLKAFITTKSGTAYGNQLTYTYK
ncbi:MAG: hypothetical protein R6U58_02885 [Bacteroidales bacterium]